MAKVKGNAGQAAVSARIITGLGIPAGYLAGKYLHELILPTGAAFWPKLAVSLAICFAVLFIFRMIGSKVGRRESSEI